MSKPVAWTTIGLIALTLIAFVGELARHYLSASLPDTCSEEYRRCAAAAEGALLGTLDCRIEIYHCRAFGAFTHPDRTVVRIPGGEER